MIKTILVATDGSAHAKKAADLAVDMARRFQARLVVLHTLLRDTDSNSLRKLVKRQDLTKEQWRLLTSYEAEMYKSMAAAEDGMIKVPPPVQVLEPVGEHIVGNVAAAAKRARVKNVKTVVSGNSPAESILKVAKQEKADLIVLGTRGLGHLKGLILGSVSHKVTAEAKCPVVTVK